MNRIFIVLLLTAFVTHGAVPHKGAYRESVKVRDTSGRVRIIYPKKLPALPFRAEPVSKEEAKKRAAILANPAPLLPWQLRIEWVWLDKDGNVLAKPGRETVVVIESQRMSDVGKWAPIGYSTNSNVFVTSGSLPARQFRVGLKP